MHKKLSHCLQLSACICLLALAFTNCSSDSTADKLASGQAGESTVLLCGKPTEYSQCDPLTAQPCDVAAGETCEFAATRHGYECLKLAPASAPGEFCDYITKFCGPTTTCNENLNRCEHYCCVDSDCARGACTPDAFEDGKASVGVCVDEYQTVLETAGAGGEGN